MSQAPGPPVARPPTARRGRRRAALAVVLLGAVLAGGVGWYGWRQPRAPEPPVLDPTGVDPAVWRAVEAARAEVRRQPASARGWGRLGMLLLAHQYRHEAVACLAQAERLDPHNVRWPYYQALALRRSDPEAALDHLRRALAAGDRDTEAPRLLLGELLLQRGQLDEAAALFDQVIDDNPGNSRAHLGRAQADFERDDMAGTLAHLRQALDDPHTRKAAHTFLASVEQRRGHRAAAETALAEARRLPDDVPWPDPLAEPVQNLVVGHLEVVTRAAALLDQNRVSEAIPLLRQAVADYPKSSWARVLLGRAWLRAGNLSAAEEVLRTALQRAPDAVEAHFYLGVVLFLREQFVAAAPCFRKATQLKPDYALAWYNLGHCLKRQGDRAGARAAFRAAVNCKPQFAEARTNLGEVLAEDGDLGAALEQLRQAVQQAPDDANARQLLETVRKRAETR